MRDPLSEIQEFLEKRDVEIKRNLSFFELSYARLGGICALCAFPENEQKFTDTLLVAKEYGVKFRVVGKMSNILPTGGIYEGLVVRTEKMKKISPLVGCDVSVECGRSLPSLASHLAECGLSGFEELSGIPGSVGGAIYMNAGAYGKEVSDVLAYASVFDLECGESKNMCREELDFSYRHSVFSEKRIFVLSASFSLRESPREDIYYKMNAYAARRREAQPSAYPSLGSAFKRRGELSAAMLIDRCGLKGARVGGACVSEKHAGFIINDRGASSEDYKKLLLHVKDRVFEEYGVLLEEEIEFLD